MIDSAKYQAQASELSQKLWAIANDLRGNMDSTKFRNYILGTIFYSYLSERTEEYMQEILKEDGLTYEQAFSDADYRPVVEQWSIEHLGLHHQAREPVPGSSCARLSAREGDADRVQRRGLRARGERVNWFHYGAGVRGCVQRSVQRHEAAGPGFGRHRCRADGAHLEGHRENQRD